uniref:Uncharacterized protein n=1 Tax=Nelumbo nucifera TaxID=4432 RepID=A0A822Y783_NELNU|nr:TPA_asm: hypothetical protein HUJ06_031332 [Nelumbo nucifera]
MWQQQQNQPLWEGDVLQRQMWERDDSHSFLAPENFLFSYNSANSGKILNRNPLLYK